ncbi:hypothetical protein [Staphylococcus sp. EZ-P03]|uniref:LEM-3-like GIY-YIG domain-containing protein n=1 Tax=Staphylococcus sp. EZ-P03 TaxID=2282739 RepID=UPI000DF7DD8B|nr:hypothetical protein [Staphylococcus sp. EZ-P03]
MEHLKRFSDSTIAYMEADANKPYYVYYLKDPRNDEIFYIGKGKGNRIFKHKEDAEQDMKEDYMFEGEKESNLKFERIGQILSEGLNVLGYIVSFKLTNNEAYAAENALINMVKMNEMYSLTNLVNGHGTSGYKVEDLEDEFGYDPMEVSDINTDEIILAVKINDGFRLCKNENVVYPEDIEKRDPDNLKMRTLGTWNVDKSLLEKDKIKYIIGINSGANNSVISAYEITSKRMKSKEKYDKNNVLRPIYTFESDSNSEEVLKKLNLYKKALPSLEFKAQCSRRYINR